ncbi:MAG: hypothetical protein UY32_C0028G0007 [Candidatus Jorgensenbacteria bacterium GW2011_GWC1_48_8]|uniref:Uncharacterized protein n=1 Tax=Candidatus Jorgensenbacteria bacterium GW2011_GWC1_48_8 TaxID=1618666 RepID=A0A0G1X6V5_9BACT|nr:MAG: hypothetical protein UY32_C0028G0007 [Candidatus Jorgensenbacteria bacterium GW2011_GWC1_48_8]
MGNFESESVADNSCFRSGPVYVGWFTSRRGSAESTR